MKKLLFILFSVILFNCSLSTKPQDSTTTVKGTIINESLNAALSNISITLYRSGCFQLIDSCYSDINGNYIMQYDSEKQINYDLRLWINLVNNNPKYPSYSIKVEVGKNENHNIYLYNYTKLIVILNSDIELTTTDRYTLYLPGIGISGLGPIKNKIFEDPHAKGNFSNQVKFIYDRNDSTYEIIDSVFCPIDTSATLIINY